MPHQLSLCWAADCGCSWSGRSLSWGEKLWLLDLTLMDAMLVVPALRLRILKEFRLGQWTEIPAVLEPDGRREAEVDAGQTWAVPLPGLYGPSGKLLLDLIKSSFSPVWRVPNFWVQSPLLNQCDQNTHRLAEVSEIMSSSIKYGWS